jgi:pilus assembly protein Flp/PilA
MFANFATLVALLQNVKSDRRAVTAMEYGLIASLIAVVIIGTVTTLGTKLNLVFSQISGSL